MEENKNGTNEEFEFIKEKIKEKPVNKRKLLLKFILTMITAVVFGVVACFAFFMAKPYVEEWMYPPEMKEVTIPREDEPETEPQVSSNEAEPVKEQPEAEPEPVIKQVVERVEIDVEDYKILYKKLFDIAEAAKASLVNVTGVSEDVDWFQDPFEMTGQSSGLIVADNGKELLILTNKSTLDKAKSVRVKFCDGMTAEGKLKKYDANSGLAVVGVELTTIGEETMDVLTKATLGNSNAAAVLGTPIIAIGSPLGYEDSVSYGFVTSASSLSAMVDTDIHKITTDIYGSKNGSGVIINLQGEVIGVITQAANTADSSNLLTCWGISDLKGIVEKLSNGKDIACLGIYGTEVTEEAHKEFGVPLGAYVTDVQMGSPAMTEGIQSGDIIIKLGTTEIGSFAEYKAAMSKAQPGDITVVTVMRQGKNDYTELSFEITLGKLE